MKKEIHPDYHNVVFHDTSSDFKFMTRSTMTSSPGRPKKYDLLNQEKPRSAVLNGIT